jgi:hypothetical protein
MSVISTFRVTADSEKVEAQSARIQEITERAKAHGQAAHRFYGSDDGQIMIVDEWPDRESFERFFEECRSDIEALWSDVGVTSEPDIKFWRKLETNDEVGWGA